HYKNTTSAPGAGKRDLCAIGRPGGIALSSIRSVRQIDLIRAIRIHQINLSVPIAEALKDDLPAIGGPVRVRVRSHRIRETRRMRSIRIHYVDLQMAGVIVAVTDKGD